MEDRNRILRVLKQISQSLSILTKPRCQQQAEEIFQDIAEQAGNKEELEMMNHLFFQLREISDRMEKMNWLNKHYRILHDFAQICSKTLDEDTLLKQAYEMVSQVMSTDSFLIAMYNEGDSFVQFEFLMDNGRMYPQKRIDLGDGYTSQAIQTRKTIHLQKATQPEDTEASFGENETSSCLFVPLIIDNQVKGVISAQSYSVFAYRKEHEELLQIIGTQVINSIETARLYQMIYMMSRTDELTGLKNHRAFHEDLANYMREANNEMTLVMLDSDNLKKINDSYGHEIGDVYLRVLSEGIKSVCTEQMEGYRYAGDEFMIIIRSSFRDKIEPLFERLKEYYRENPINLQNNQITVSISAGVAYFPEHGSTVDSLKKSADTALYLAKSQNQNCMFIAE